MSEHEQHHPSSEPHHAQELPTQQELYTHHSADRIRKLSPKAEDNFEAEVMLRTRKLSAIRRDIEHEVNVANSNKDIKTLKQTGDKLQKLFTLIKLHERTQKLH